MIDRRPIGLAVAALILMTAGSPRLLSLSERQRTGCDLLAQRLAEKVEAKKEWFEYTGRWHGPLLIEDGMDETVSTLPASCPELVRRFPKMEVEFLGRRLPSDDLSKFSEHWITRWQLPVISLDGRSARLTESMHSRDGQTGGGQQIFFSRDADGRWKQTSIGLRWAS